MEATLTVKLPDGTTRTLELSDVSASTQEILSQPFPHEPGVPVVPVTALNLYAKVDSDTRSA